MVKKIILFSILIGVIAFLGVSYFGILKAKDRVESQLNQNRLQLDSLQVALKQEKSLTERLNKEKAALADNLKAAGEELVQLKEKNIKAQENIFSLIEEIKNIQKEKLEIESQTDSLEDKIKLLEDENYQLEAKLHSLTELKKAIRELKIERKRFRSLKLKASSVSIASPPEPLAQPGVDTFIKESVDSLESQKGNSGFIVKDGFSTLIPQVKIEVEPAQ